MSIKRWILRAAAVSGVHRLAPRLWGQSIAVLMYHYFSQRPSGDPLTVDADSFARQMRYLARHYHPLRLDEAIETLRHGRTLPPRSVAITVDDVGVDFLEFAWPVLSELAIPVCLAVCPAFVDPEQQRARVFGVAHAQLRIKDRIPRLASALGIAPFAYADCFDRLYGIDPARLADAFASIGVSLDLRDRLPGSVRFPLLGLDELQTLAGTGLAELAAHSMSHPPFNWIDQAWARWEIEESQRSIQRHFGRCAGFVFPGGAKAVPARATDALVEAAGYRYACITRPALVSASTPHFSLGRVAIDGTENQQMFRLRVSGLPAMLQGRAA